MAYSTFCTASYLVCDKKIIAIQILAELRKKGPIFWTGMLIYMKVIILVCINVQACENSFPNNSQRFIFWDLDCFGIR